jgi:hypothetical protein
MAEAVSNQTSHFVQFSYVLSIDLCGEVMSCLSRALQFIVSFRPIRREFVGQIATPQGVLFGRIP